MIVDQSGVSQDPKPWNRLPISDLGFYRAYIELSSRVRVVVVVVSVLAAQPARKIATSPRNVSAIRFVFIVTRKRIPRARRMF
jgi:hypothetical protein